MLSILKNHTCKHAYTPHYLDTTFFFSDCLLTVSAASLHVLEWICLSLNKSPVSFGWLLLLFTHGNVSKRVLMYCDVNLVWPVSNAFKKQATQLLWSPELENSAVKLSEGSDILMIFVWAMESWIYERSFISNSQMFFYHLKEELMTWKRSGLSVSQMLPLELFLLQV